MSSTTTYGVTGMTCGHCVSALTEELGKVPGVRDVTVDLVPHGRSLAHVSADDDLDEQQVRDAVDEAGFELSPDVA